MPIDSFTSFIENNISEERAGSLQFRFDNEDGLLERAALKPLSGWGGWGRARVYDEYGIDRTIVDGLWIIMLGERGWIGYIGFFGLLTVPMLMLARAARHKPVSHVTVAMGVIMAANLIYLVPNSALSPIGWLFGGALAGFVAWREVEVSAEQAEGNDRDQGERPRSRYTRFSNNGPRPEARQATRSIYARNHGKSGFGKT